MVTIRTPCNRADWDEVTTLLSEFIEWMRTAAGFDPFVAQPAFAAELADLERHYAAPDRRFFLATDGRCGVGTVALQLHDDATAELKRMYVRPSARGAGVADALIAAAVTHAADRSCRVVWLESKRGPMDPAIAVYRRHQFEEASNRAQTLDLADLVVMERALASS